MAGSGAGELMGRRVVVAGPPTPSPASPISCSTLLNYFHIGGFGLFLVDAAAVVDGRHPLAPLAAVDTGTVSATSTADGHVLLSWILSHWRRALARASSAFSAACRALSAAAAFLPAALPLPDQRTLAR